MTIEKSFKTKMGYCHILSDKIVFTRDDIIGNLAKVTVGNNITRILLIYTSCSMGLFYVAFNSYSHGEIAMPILFILIGGFLIFSIITSLNNSATPVIYRSRIKGIKLKKGIRGLTRSRFIVKFEADYGKVKKRLIMLPGSLTDGQAETEKALQIMRE